MKRKQLWRVLGTGCLAASLLVSPMTGLSALAAGETGDDAGTTQADGTGTDAKTGGSVTKLDPLRTEAVGTEGEANYKPAYADVDIPVYGFTQDATVYSVDVEWGAMTFQYENSTWDPETHTKKTDNAGWRVYDSVNDKVVMLADGTAPATEDAINEIKVTNHSNAGVWATLTYAEEANHTGTTGTFTKGTETGDTTVLTEAAGTVPAYLTLTTADNGADGAAGTATVGKAYFMPDGISADDKTNGINKWTKIGTITVGIKTAQPTATTPTEP